MVPGFYRPPFASFTTVLTSASARGLDINVPNNRRQDDLMRTQDERGSLPLVERWEDEDGGDDDDDSFFHVQYFPFAVACRQRPRVYISDFYPDERESFVHSDEAEVNVEVYSVRDGEAPKEALQVQRLRVGIFRLSSLRILPALCRRLSQRLRRLARSQC